MKYDEINARRSITYFKGFIVIIVERPVDGPVRSRNVILKNNLNQNEPIRLLQGMEYRCFTAKLSGTYHHRNRICALLFENRRITAHRHQIGCHIMLKAGHFSSRKVHLTN